VSVYSKQSKWTCSAIARQETSLVCHRCRTTAHFLASSAAHSSRTSTRSISTPTPRLPGYGSLLLGWSHSSTPRSLLPISMPFATCINRSPRCLPSKCLLPVAIRLHPLARSPRQERQVEVVLRPLRSLGYPSWLSLFAPSLRSVHGGSGYDESMVKAIRAVSVTTTMGSLRSVLDVAMTRTQSTKVSVSRG
jgi:hypothetical protein